MVDWVSQSEIQQDAVHFTRLMHVLLGLYIWELFNTIDFEWSFISGKRRFRWPLVIYFACRYSLLFSLIGITIALDNTKPINCLVLYTFNAIFGNVAVGTASLNLMFRVIALWGQGLYVVIPLVAIALGQWSLLLHGLLVKAKWVEGQGCVVTNAQNNILGAMFIYTMCFDLIFVVLTAIKLGLHRRGRSALVNMLFKDGLVYFLIAWCANLIPTIFILLNLNPIMSIIFNVPAATATAIASCRAVRRLSEFLNREINVHVPESTISGFKAATRPSTQSSRSNTLPVFVRTGSGTTTNQNGLYPTPNHGLTNGRGGDTAVHISMQTYTVDEVDVSARYKADGSRLSFICDGIESQEDIADHKDSRRSSTPI